jgi:NADP-dependent 3-hydroxy acid dehydrogenase YdfG
MELAGRVAIVTGASSGIGTAVAKELDLAGMKLVLTARREQRLQRICSELREAVWVAGDIADEGLPQHLLDTALAQFDQCDVLVNNAGLITTGTIEEIDLNRVTDMVRVNVEAAIRMAYLALRQFKAQGEGHLVNISSILGVKTRPTAGAYSGTKYAMESFSHALRLELAGTGIGVSSIGPGLVMTELHNHMPVHPSESFNIQKPLQPEDIARNVRYVLEQPEHVRIASMMILPEDSPL